VGDGGADDDVVGGGGNDTIVLNGASVTGDIEGGSDNDVIALLNGTVDDDVDGGSGNDTITLNGAAVGGDLEGDSGNDLIRLISGSVGNDVDGGSGEDSIILNGASITNDVDGGSGNDMVSLLAGTVGNDVDGGPGNDTITLNGATVAEEILGGSGNDLIRLLSGSAGNDFGDEVDGGSGDDSIVLNGASIAGDLVGNSGNDVFNLVTGTFGDDLEGNSGADMATIQSSFNLNTINGVLDGGGGPDDVPSANEDSINIRASGMLRGEQILNWEQVNIVGGASLSLADDGLASESLVTSENDGYGVFVRNGVLNLGDDSDGGGTDFTVDGDVTVEIAGRLVAATGSGDGDFFITDDLRNNGTVDMTGAFAAAGDMLSVSGDYAAGSDLWMDANLNDSFLGDTLVVAGLIGGVTEITVTDTAPFDLPAWSGHYPGAGILLVDNPALDVVEGDFILDPVSHPNDEVLKVPFSYTLQTYEEDGEVRLQSEVLGQIYGYSILAEVLREQFPTLRERLGNERVAAYAAGADGGGEGTASNGVWARVEGDHRKSEAKNPNSTPFNGGDWDQTRGEIAIGLDVPVPAGGGTLLVGAHGHVIHTSADAKSGRAGSGTSDVKGTGFGLGAGAAYLAEGGFYADLQGRVTFWDTDVDFDPRGISEDIDATSWGLSLEIGQRLDLGGGLSITPRGQAVYTDVDFSSFTDGDGVRVSQSDSDSLTLGAGLLVEQAMAESGVRVYADVSAEFDLLDDSSINASKFNFESGLADAWGNLAVGAAMPLGEGVSAYLQGEIGSALDHGFGDSMSYGGKLGIQINF
jgi:fibronectin-binding autotransporter adhesin